MVKTLKRKINIWLFFVIFLFVPLYFYKLGEIPVHLNQDELGFSLNAFSISQIFRDTSGRFLPFYFWHLGGFWATPIIIYLTSFFLSFLPFSVASIRVSSVVVGFSTVFLLTFLVEKMFQDRKLTILSALMVVTTPVLFIHSRLLLDNLYIVPFVLLWLLFLKNKQYFWSGLLLGIGIHSYHAAKIYMPVYFLAGLAFLYFEKQFNRKNFTKLFLGFLIPLILFFPWLQEHPDTLLNKVSYIDSLDQSVNISKGIWGVFNPSRLTDIAGNYITYFSPKLLFFEGDRSLIHSTGEIGAFLLPLAPLLVFGSLEVIRQKDKFGKLILFGFLSYPLAPSIVNDPQRISGGLVSIVFVILLSTYGLKFFFNRKGKPFRYFLIFIAIWGTVQFGLFINDYFGDYRVRSDSWFNGGIEKKMRSALDLYDQNQAEWIYIDQSIYFGRTYMSFVEVEQDRALGHKKVVFKPGSNDTIPKNSIVVLNDKIYYEE